MDAQQINILQKNKTKETIHFCYTGYQTKFKIQSTFFCK